MFLAEVQLTPARPLAPATHPGYAVEALARAASAAPAPATDAAAAQTVAARGGEEAQARQQARSHLLGARATRIW